MTRQPKWTPEENNAVCGLYFIMSEHVLTDAEYNKAAMIRAAQGIRLDGSISNPDAQLRLRSRGSIEAKLMNVTACLRDLGGAFTERSLEEHGYRAMSNYQADLKQVVARFFDPINVSGEHVA